MEFERYTYGMHRFILSRDCCRSCLTNTLLVSVFLLAFLFPTFLYGNFVYVEKSSCLEPIITANYKLDPYSEINSTNDNRKIIKPYDILDVYVLDPGAAINLTDESTNWAHFEFSGSDFLVSMNKTTKMGHNFTYHTIILDSTCFGKFGITRYIIDSIFEFSNILTNEIIISMKGYSAHLKNMKDINHSFKISNETIQDIYDFRNSDYKLILVCLNLLKILFGLFLLFTVSALQIRVFYIYFPVWFFFGTDRNPRLQREAIRQYSWIGIYYHTLTINRKSTLWIFLSQYMCYFLFQRLIMSVEQYWSFLLFDKPCPRSYVGSYCGLIYFTELLSIIFVRTRSSLKYIPRICVLIFTMYAYYFQHTVHGFYNLGLWLVVYSQTILFTYFLLTFEKPALYWDQTHHYTPSNSCPRTLFFPIFSTTWMHDLPPFWTMFYPLFGRSHFSTRELALVNNNYPLLRQILSEAHDRGTNFEENMANMENIEEAPIVPQNLDQEPDQESPIRIDVPMNQREINEEASQQTLIRNIEEGTSP